MAPASVGTAGAATGAIGEAAWAAVPAAGAVAVTVVCACTLNTTATEAATKKRREDSLLSHFDRGTAPQSWPVFTSNAVAEGDSTLHGKSMDNFRQGLGVTEEGQ